MENRQGGTSPEEQPITGDVYTDLYKSRGRIYNVGGAGGFSFTKFAPNGLSWVSLGLFLGALLLWSVPIMTSGLLTPKSLKGFGLLIIFGPPVLLPWLAGKEMPYRKSLYDLIASYARHKFTEKPHYIGATPTTERAEDLTIRFWTPRNGGINE